MTPCPNVRPSPRWRRRGVFLRRARAMTLVEVLAVVVILGLLASTLAVSFSGAFSRGKRELAKTALAHLVSKVELYRLETDAWPPADAGLAVLSDGFALPSAPYYVSPDQLTDPWNAPFYIIVPGPDAHPYEIVSYGADRQPGGEGDNADVSSLQLRR